MTIKSSASALHQRFSLRSVTCLLFGLFLATHETLVTAQDNQTVWDGIYTTEQAERGERVYQDECTFCHLDDLQGDSFATPLIEDAFTTRWDGSNIADFMTVIQITMPADRPATLSDEAVAEVVAFILQMNEFPAGDHELEADFLAHKETLFTNPD